MKPLRIGGVRVDMRPSSSTYRLLSAVVTAAMVWAVVLPVVHMACAMDRAATAAVCEHAAPPNAGQAGVHGHEMQAPTHAAEKSEANSHGPDDAMACCIVEASGIDTSAIPVRIGDDSPRVALGGLLATFADVHALQDPFPIRALDRTGAVQAAPSTSPISLAFLSVFLI